MAIVTHEMEFARDVSTRVFYMDEGLIYEEGPPEQIFGNPQRERTRDFIGKVRSLTWRVESADYDLYALVGRIEGFCEKHLIPHRTAHQGHLTTGRQRQGTALRKSRGEIHREAPQFSLEFGEILAQGRADRALGADEEGNENEFTLTAAGWRRALVATTSGFLPEEREWIDVYLSNGFKDAFREIYPEKVQYTWWTYRFTARARNIGWRLDYYLVSDRFLNNVKDVIIHEEIQGSDHCPVSLII